MSRRRTESIGETEAGTRAYLEGPFGAFTLDELAELEDELDLEVVHVLEDPPDDWEGETGRFTPELVDGRLEVGDPDGLQSDR